MGAAGAQPDAVPSGVVARPGDTVFVDLWSRRRHYAGDSTRSFTVGPAPSWALHAHEALLAAREAVETLLIPGAPVAEVDRRCRDTVRSRAGEATYRHHTGHGLGLTAGEPPLIDEGSPGELCEGEVIAIEPGVYVAGRGGLRLEEVYLITSAGPRALTGFARRLTECATGGEGGGEAAPAKPV
jgi:Xaa-Pro aminopeptidase